MTVRVVSITVVTAVVLYATSTTALAADPQGIYSADELMDAKVYVGDAKDPVGEIDDIIFDNNMRIKSFIVEANGKYGLGGKSYVVSPEQMAVKALAGEQATEPSYRATLNAGNKRLSDYPKYDDAWWQNAQRTASDAWQQTKESAGNAWTQIKKGTNDLIDRAQGQTQNSSSDPAPDDDRMNDSASDNNTSADSDTRDNNP